MFQKETRYDCGKRRSPIKYALRLLSLFSFVAVLSITPVYADTAQAGMFSALDTAYKWIRGIFLVMAAVSLASYAFSFFCVSQLGSGRDGEKAVTSAKSKMIATCIAAAAIFLVPNVIKAGQDFAKDIAWKSGSSVDATDADTIHSALGGNHIISSADTSSGKITEIEESPEEDDDDGGEGP